MILRTVLGGPGPSTLAFRQSFGHVRFPNARPGPVAYGLRQASTLKRHRKKREFTEVEARESTATALNGPSQSVLDHTVLLPAPLDQQKHGPAIGFLRDALRDQDLVSAAQAYGRILDWSATGELEDEDWRGVSTFLSGQLNPFNSRRSRSAADVAKIIHRQPEVYGWIATMAIDAASRDHWTGLYWLAISLIAIGRPQAVIDACDRYRTGLFHIQGKDRKDLVSWNREKRLAARIGGEGIKPICMVNIAALTMLNQLDGSNIQQLFGTRANWRQADDSVVYDIQAALSRSPDAKGLIAGFRDGLEKFLFALLCYHPNSLDDRLRSLARSKSWFEFDRVYGLLIAWSTGKDRFLRPMDLDHRDDQLATSDIAIPAFIWRKLMKWHSVTVIMSFRKREQPAEIFHLIDVILPERGLTPTPEILACALQALAHLHKDTRISDSVREASLGFLGQLTTYIESRRLEATDEILAARIDVLHILDAPDAIDDLYDNVAQQGPRKNVGPLTRAALAHVYVSMDRFDRAVQVLQWTSGDNSHPRDYEPYRRYVRSVIKRGSPGVRHKLSQRQMMVAIADALRVKPKYLKLPYQTMVLQSTFRIADSVEAGTKQIMRILNTDGKPHFKIWRIILETLLTRTSAKHRTTPNEAQVGLKILQRFVQVELEGGSDHLAKNKVEQFWSIYLRHVGLSTAITPSKRRKYLTTAIEIFERKYGSGAMSNSARFGMVSTALSRGDSHSLSDGIFWWDEFREEKRSTPFWWLNMVNSLRRANHIEAVYELVSACWNDDDVPKTFSFWDTMLEYGILEKINISAKDLEHARSLSLQPADQLREVVQGVDVSMHMPERIRAREQSQIRNTDRVELEEAGEIDDVEESESEIVLDEDELEEDLEERRQELGLSIVEEEAA